MYPHPFPCRPFTCLPFPSPSVPPSFILLLPFHGVSLSSLFIHGCSSVFLLLFFLLLPSTFHFIYVFFFCLFTSRPVSVPRNYIYLFLYPFFYFLFPYVVISILYPKLVISILYPHSLSVLYRFFIPHFFVVTLYLPLFYPHTFYSLSLLFHYLSLIFHTLIYTYSLSLLYYHFISFPSVHSLTHSFTFFFLLTLF